MLETDVLFNGFETTATPSDAKAGSKDSEIMIRMWRGLEMAEEGYAQILDRHLEERQRVPNYRPRILQQTSQP